MAQRRRGASLDARVVTAAQVAAFGVPPGYSRAICLKPGEPSPLDVDNAEPPEWMRDDFRRDDWRQAWELRCTLEAAAKEKPCARASR